MNRNKRPEKESMTPLQKQAVLVCLVCAFAVLLTVGITLTMLRRGKTASPPQPDSEPQSSQSEPQPGENLAEHYQIDETSAALLPETADAGDAYLNETLFLGDSNTVRLYTNGLISLQQFCAREGIGTQAALHDKIVTFKKDDTDYTIAQAVAKMKPRRVVLTFGTNDASMDVASFTASYTALIQAIQASYPYTDIIVNTIPPIPVNHSSYPNLDQAKIDDFNMALLSLCEQMDLKFLNSAEALKDESGYGRADYYTSGDIHLKSGGLKAMLSYLRTHAWQTEDRRPDTSNIPTRTLEYSSNPSSAVAAPSSSSQAQAARYEARYQVEGKGGGTLSCGNDAGKTALVYGVADGSESYTVTATPSEGYVFVKWSDGVTSRTRTDTNFKQNLDVTAVFSSASVQITSEGKGFLGSSYTFRAAVKGKYITTDNIRWYANGQEVKEAAGRSSIKVMVSPELLNATYKIYATVSYNDCTVTSNTLVIEVGGAEPEAPSSSSGASSSSAASSSGASSSEAASSSSSKPDASSSESTSGASSSGSTSGASSESGASSISPPESSSSSASSSGSSSEVTSSSHSAASSEEREPESLSSSSSAHSGSTSSSKPEEPAKPESSSSSHTASASSAERGASSGEAAASRDSAAPGSAE